ncbi:protein ripply1 [Lampris incognitus]|uniref:protein ripply1 n=1 Tax=Lampris incognitus TaxID=2546036 RepID=UPI0024B5B03D|nr:protein ripply1 [Lampris incognitus]
MALQFSAPLTGFAGRPSGAAEMSPRVKPAAFAAAQPNRSHSSLWRPWLETSRDSQDGRSRSKLSCPYSRPVLPGCLSSDGKPQAFQHPVRLFWPKSKSFDYLYSSGEALLRNFPIQATISFYDESDSEDEEEEDDVCEEDADAGESLRPDSHFTSYN